ncbi:MAG TPA: hypothetical protein VKU87_12860 [Thermomicrobiaceae bacterium]|nr:hypothetical protein [Thermomicrobiaceae bacterium]
MQRGKRSLTLILSVLLLLVALLTPLGGASAASNQASVYLVALNDTSGAGGTAGCGDSLVPVTVDLGSASTTEAKISAALTRVFAIHSQYYGQSGLYDALYQSHLTVDSVRLDGTRAIVNLSCSFSLGGECDTPRVLGQIERTITQFSGADSTYVVYKGNLLQFVLSGQGQPPNYRFFPETDHLVGNGFLNYWKTYGGLAVFGYPISDEMVQNGVTVQWFERARFEWHPGSDPAHFDVLLGLLGNEATTSRQGSGPFARASQNNAGGCVYFAATGHNLCGGFYAYWKKFGGLAIYGMPISEEFVENGVRVQYFERQRFEWHPGAWPQRYDVELGLLGVQLYR